MSQQGFLFHTAPEINAGRMQSDSLVEIQRKTIKIEPYLQVLSHCGQFWPL